MYRYRDSVVVTPQYSTKEYLLKCNVTYYPENGRSVDGEVTPDFKIKWDDGTEDTDLNTDNGLLVLRDCDLFYKREYQ